MKYPSFLLLLSILFYSSCQENKKSDEVSGLDEELSISVIDTIKLDYQGNLSITDYQEKNQHFIAFDRSRNSEVIIVFNRMGEILDIFNNNLAGENAFYGKFNSVGFDPQGSGYILSSHGGVYRYDSAWHLLKKWPNPDTEIGGPVNPTGKHFILNEKGTTNTYFLSILNSSHINEIKQDKAFYNKVKNFTLVNFNDSIYSVKLGIDEKSIYRTANRQYSSYFAKYDYNDFNKRLYVTYTNDPTLYQYSFQNGDFVLENRIDYTLDYYKVKSDYKYGEQINIYEFGLDSRIEGINTYNEITFIDYVKAMDHEKFKLAGGKYQPNKFYQKFIFSNYRHCLSVLKNGKKTAKDAILPDFVGLPQLALSKNTLLYSLAKFKYEFEGEVFIIVNLKQK